MRQIKLVLQACAIVFGALAVAGTIAVGLNAVAEALLPMPVAPSQPETIHSHYDPDTGVACYWWYKASMSCVQVRQGTKP